MANDHLVDDASDFAPHEPQTSDHGIVFATTRKKKKPAPADPAGGAVVQPADLSLT